MKAKIIVITMTVFLMVLGTSVIAQEGWKETGVEDMDVAWRFAGQSVEFRVSAPTEGWVAIGFEPSRAMADADIKIGYVGRNGEVVVEDHFGNGPFTHRADDRLGGSSDVVVLGGSESSGRTEIHFSMPVDSGDRYDKVYRSGDTYTVILAWGTSDNIGRKHQKRYSTELTL